MKSFIIATILSSAFAFAPSRLTTKFPAQTALHATSSRRQLIQNASASFLVLSFPTLTNAADATSYATSIEQSTNLLSQSLGHAILVIDGMNNQAKRLGSSPSPAHPIAVLDGLHAQAKRLTHDLDTSKSVLESIKDQAKEITINDEKLGIVGTSFHTLPGKSAVLDGMVAQSKRLEGASNSGGGVNTDDEIIYMLSILDGLNSQVRRLDREKTFSMLDEINAKASMALL